MIFFAVFLVSCGGLLEEEPRNTVRITMPGNGRAVSASGASDVKYYNIQIASQNFSIIPPGSTVESAPLPVGMSVSISVEAIGKINDVQGAPVITERRIAYYQTSERLPAEGLTLNVNMANYKTEYHKVTLNPNGFNGQQTSVEVYVAGGSSYTLPNYGTYRPTQGAPRKHTTWESKQPAMVKQAGESITVTEDMEFSVQWDVYATITFNLNTYSNLQSMITGYKQTDYAERNTRYTPPNYGSVTDTSTPTPEYYNHVGWKFFPTAVSNGEDLALNQSVTITDDARFEPIFSKRIELYVNNATIDVASSSSITEEGGKYYIWTHQPFILPKGTKTVDGSEVQTWTCGQGSSFPGSPGQSLSYDEWEGEVCNGFAISVY